MSTTETRHDRDEQRFALQAFFFWWVVTALWWLFAFAPFGVLAPTLVQAQAVCFGTLPNGLPDTWGWGLLIVAPMSMLGFLLAVWGEALREGLRGALRRHRTASAVSAMLLVATLITVGQAFVNAARIEAEFAFIESGDLAPDYPQLNRDAGPLGLVDQTGAVRTVAAEAGTLLVVTFAYAHCSTICPAIVHVTREAVNAARAEGIPARLLIVTLDPWRDTPSSLPTLAKSWEIDASTGDAVLSGSVEDVTAVLRAWDMPFERNEQDGEVTHPALVYVLDSAGRLQYGLNSPSDRAVLQALQRLRDLPG